MTENEVIISYGQKIFKNCIKGKKRITSNTTPTYNLATNTEWNGKSICLFGEECSEVNQNVTIRDDIRECKKS